MVIWFYYLRNYKTVLKYLLNIEMKDLVHERGQFCHEGFISVVLAHVRNQDSPERHRRNY